MLTEEEWLTLKTGDCVKIEYNGADWYYLISGKPPSSPYFLDVIDLRDERPHPSDLAFGFRSSTEKVSLFQALLAIESND